MKIDPGTVLSLLCDLQNLNAALVRENEQLRAALAQHVPKAPTVGDPA